MASEELKVTVGLNNKQFNTEMKDMNKELREAQKQFSNTEKEMNLLENSEESVAKATKSLNNVQEKQTNILKAQEKRLKELKDSEMDLVKTKNNLAREIQTVTAKFEKAKKELGENARETKQYEKELKDLNISLGKTDKALTSTKRNINAIASAMKTTQSEIDVTAARMENLGKKSEGSTKGAGSSKGGKAATGIVVADAAIAVAEKVQEPFQKATDATKDLITNAVEVNTAFGKMSLAIGKSGKDADKLKERAIRLFEEGFDMETAQNSLLETERILGDMFDDEQADIMAEKLATMSEVLGTDISESARVAEKMIKNFGISGNEALDIITTGFQQGLDDDFADTLTEYSIDFQEVGFSAKDAFETMQEGAKLGLRNTDVLADGVREATQSLMDMDDATKDSLKSLKLNWKDVQKNMSEGGEPAKKQLTEIAKRISAMDDGLEKNQVAQGIWKTLWEDNGGAVYKALGLVDGQITDLEGNTVAIDGATGNLVDTFDEVQKQNGAETINKIKIKLIELGEKLLPIADMLIQIVDKIVEFIDQHPIIIDAIKDLLPFIGLLGIALGLLLSPFTLIAGAITLIATGLDILIRKIPEFVEFFKQKFNEWMAWMRENHPTIAGLIDGIVQLFRDVDWSAVFMDWLFLMSGLLGKIFLGLTTDVGTGLISMLNAFIEFDWSTVWDGVKKAFDRMWTYVKNNFSPMSLLKGALGAGGIVGNLVGAVLPESISLMSLNLDSNFMPYAAVGRGARVAQEFGHIEGSMTNAPNNYSNLNNNDMNLADLLSKLVENTSKPVLAPTLNINSPTESSVDTYRKTKNMLRDLARTT